MKVSVTWEFDDDVSYEDAEACVEYYLDHGMSGGYDDGEDEIATYGPYLSEE
jgi:hypothetical protein